MRKPFSATQAQFRKILPTRFTLQIELWQLSGECRLFCCKIFCHPWDYLCNFQVESESWLETHKTIYYAHRLNRFEDVAADCRAALELDPNMVKGHHFLGQALCELDMMDDGVKHLQRAVDLAKEQRL